MGGPIKTNLSFLLLVSSVSDFASHHEFNHNRDGITVAEDMETIQVTHFMKYLI